MKAAIAVAVNANHGFDRQMAKPVSAMMSQAAAINSAMRASPFGVIIWVTGSSIAIHIARAQRADSEYSRVRLRSPVEQVKCT